MSDFGFDADADFPETETECEEEMADIVDMMNQIDLQFSLHKNGLLKTDDPTWHPRALAAKGHMIRRLKDLKLAKSDFREERVASGKKAREEAKHQAKSEHEARRNRNCARTRARLQRITDWAWENFPERREEMSRVLHSDDHPTP